MNHAMQIIDLLPKHTVQVQSPLQKSDTYLLLGTVQQPAVA